MYEVLATLLFINTIALITVVLLQQGKSAGLSGAISGGAEQLFGKQKARGMEGILHRLTIILGVSFMVVTFLLGYIVQ
ncbi:preprotein translocase subunit SecG [Alkalibacillus salilacus]|uniref:Protein-export membrane protein SecG n=1 Tax=Alkalibacillus salilacus TaxID=284582 RepID=A0ABT9VF07_9BACI|nr:preprotein translocase subunit SecG [Alkalibacillus salilacus]MDQ0159561.1 preprotein translocase subunit SecG [Alkalibacillus salilacus]